MRERRSAHWNTSVSVLVASKARIMRRHRGSRWIVSSVVAINRGRILDEVMEDARRHTDPLSDESMMRRYWLKTKCVWVLQVLFKLS